MLQSVAGCPQRFQWFLLTVGGSVRHDLQHGFEASVSGRPIGSVKLLARDPWRYLYALRANGH
jgi:hypothetical protein